jgi:hypothetical protein
MLSTSTYLSAAHPAAFFISSCVMVFPISSRETKSSLLA